MAKPIRWIGFDMDECIGSVMPLFVFVTDMPHYCVVNKMSDKYDQILYELANNLYMGEQLRKTCLLRPAMFHVLKIVYKAHKSQKIQGAFLYSNNGSKELVDFMVFFLNVCIWTMYDTEKKYPIVFQMGCWNGMSARAKYGLVKNFEGIQACLADLHLPQCSSVNDLLFFDDIVHDLKQEIPHYTRVPAYFHQTNMQSLLETISPIAKYFTKEQWDKMLAETRQNIKNDFRRPANEYLSTRQSVQDEIRDIRIFSTALTNFFLTKKTVKNSVKNNKKSRLSTMKNPRFF